MRESGWRGKLAGFAKSQLSITALLTPVLAASFGRISLIAPVANAVAIPAFGLVLLPAVLAGSALAAVAPAATAGLWRLLAAILDRAWPALEAMASWPCASWSPAAQPLALMAVAGALAFAALLVPIAGLRLAAAAMLLAITCGRAEKPDAGAFSLAVIDVGQGLAAVVETAHHALVFDTRAALARRSAGGAGIAPALPARAGHSRHRPARREPRRPGSCRRRRNSCGANCASGAR